MDPYRRYLTGRSVGVRDVVFVQDPKTNSPSTLMRTKKVTLRWTDVQWPVESRFGIYGRSYQLMPKVKSSANTPSAPLEPTHALRSRVISGLCRKVKRRSMCIRRPNARPPGPAAVTTANCAVLLPRSLFDPEAYHSIWFASTSDAANQHPFLSTSLTTSRLTREASIQCIRLPGHLRLDRNHSV